MSEQFNTKARNYLADFSEFPKSTHPSWKGFPQNQWQKNLESMDWGGASFTENKEWSLDQLPFSVTQFSVLGFFGSDLRWLKDEPSSVKVGLNSDSSPEGSIGDSFQKLSYKMSRPGMEIEIPEGVQLEQPILCLVFPGSESSWVIFTHRVRMSRNSKASLVFVNASGGKLNSLTSNLVFGELEEASVLKFAHLGGFGILENSHAHFSFFQKKDSSLELLDMGTGVGLGRSEIHVNLNEPQAKADVSGVHLLRDSQVYDTRVKINHHSADTLSRQNFKCVIADKAHSIFGGHIIIQKDAQRVDSAQSHKALIISKGAKSSAFPELEVHADDVKAAHGSSTGQMDPEQIFYLKSRGLTEKDAIHLLSEAFVKDVVLKQSDSKIRSLLEETLAQALPQFVKQMESRWMEKQ